jgi:predicted Zn finger-like uncharacterized protein
MRIAVSCPQCDAKLKVEERLIGKSVKCPKCSHRFTIAAPVAPAPTETPKVPPATDRQKEYARELGIAFDDSIDRRQISHLIDDAVKRRDEERNTRVLAMEEREKDAWVKMREEVLEELLEDHTLLTEASPNEMIEELTDRGVTAVLITCGDRTLDAIEEFSEEEADISGVSVSIEHTDDLTDAYMRRLVKILGASMINQDGGF